MTGRLTPPRRWPLALAYLTLAAGGAAAMVWPSPSVSRTGATQATAWACLLIVGGLASASGVILGRWAGEYVGLPALAAVFAVYCLAAWWAVANGVTSSAPVALVLFAFTSFLIWRWAGVRIEREIARQVADHSAGGDQ